MAVDYFDDRFRLHLPHIVDFVSTTFTIADAFVSELKLAKGSRLWVKIDSQGRLMISSFDTALAMFFGPAPLSGVKRQDSTVIRLEVYVLQVAWFEARFVRSDDSHAAALETQARPLLCLREMKVLTLKLPRLSARNRIWPRLRASSSRRSRPQVDESSARHRRRFWSCVVIMLCRLG